MINRKTYTPVTCASGFSMSVQASSLSYSNPRTDNATKYDEVEVGFPSAEEPMLIEYAENPNDPTGTVYGWVPAQVVTNVIAKHGGIVSGELPPGIPYLSV